MGAKKQNGAKSSLGENGLRLLAGDTEALRAEKGEEVGGGAESGRQEAAVAELRGPISGIWLTFNERWQTF